MPPVIDFVANAYLLRRGNTDYVETTRGWKPARTFDGATGRWRVTRVGRKWFGRAGMPRSEYVILLPAVFKKLKKQTESSPIEAGTLLLDFQITCAGRLSAFFL